MCFIIVAKNSVYTRFPKRFHLWGQTDLFKLRGIKGPLRGFQGVLRCTKGFRGATCDS